MGHLGSAQNGDPFTVQQVPGSFISCTWPAGYLGRADVAKQCRICGGFPKPRSDVFLQPNNVLHHHCQISHSAAVPCHPGLEAGSHILKFWKALE